MRLLVVLLSSFVSAVWAGCHRDQDKDHLWRENCSALGFSNVPPGFEPTTQVMLFPKNQFSSLSWSSFQIFTKIYELDFTGNKILEVTPSVTPILPTLSVLRLGSNHLKFLPDGSFSACPALTELYLDNNGMDSLSDLTFSGLSKLEILDLSFNRIKVLPELMLHPLTTIETIYLEFNQITVMPDDWFSQKEEVPYLFLSANPWACYCSLGYLYKYLDEFESNVYVREVDGDSDFKIGVDRVICASPPRLKNQPVIDLEKSDLCPPTTESGPSKDFNQPVTYDTDTTTTVPDTTPNPTPTTTVPDTTPNPTPITTVPNPTPTTTVPDTTPTPTVPDTTPNPTPTTTVPDTTPNPTPTTTVPDTTPTPTVPDTTPTPTPTTTVPDTTPTTTVPDTTPTPTVPDTTPNPTPTTTATATTTTSTGITPTVARSWSEVKVEVPSHTVGNLAKLGSGGQVRGAAVFCFWLFAGSLLLCTLSAACVLTTLARTIVWYRRVYRPLSATLERIRGGDEVVRLLTYKKEVAGGGGVMALYRSVLFVHREGGDAMERGGEGGEGGKGRLLVTLEPTGGIGGAASEAGERRGREEKGVYRKMLYRLSSKEKEVEGWRDVVEEWRVSTEEGGRRRGEEASGGVSRKRYSVILREEREEAGAGREELDWVVGGWEVNKGGGEWEEDGPRSSWGEWLAGYLPSMPWGVTTPPESEAAL